MPGLTTKTLGTGDYTWMYNTRGIRDGVSGVLDISTFTLATHFPNGFVRCGTPVKINDLDVIVPWTDAAGNKLGFVGGDYETDGVEDVNVHIITHPETVYIDRLPVTFTAPVTAIVPHIYFMTRG
jgi:hypothetical protein